MESFRWISLSAFATVAVLLSGCVTDSGGAKEATFVGSEKCGECHEVEYKSWKSSNHAKMVRPLKEGLLKDAGEKWASDGKNPGPTKGNADGKTYKMEDVDYVIGSYWKQRYLVKNPATGNHQFLDKQFNRMSKQWEPYGNKNDWETNCSTCHATAFRILSYDPANPAAQKVTMNELNTGCEACHGPGSKHSAKSKIKIFNPAKVSNAEHSKVCGYCHIRAENHKFKTAQGNPSEYLPHPEIGQTYKAGQDDWTTWYPEELTVPGVNSKYPYEKEYTGDLKGMFIVDDLSKKFGFYDPGKHHQQYQAYIQSTHYTKDVGSCSSCHAPHAIEDKPAAKPATSCQGQGCHDSQFDWQKNMPGTGQTALNLFVRTHTFNKNESRPPKPTASGEPEYFYKK
jgi:Cytochrome c554 and c-prime